MPNGGRKRLEIYVQLSTTFSRLMIRMLGSAALVVIRSMNVSTAIATTIWFATFKASRNINYICNNMVCNTEFFLTDYISFFFAEVCIIEDWS
jgi:hypothetical protein